MPWSYEVCLTKVARMITCRRESDYHCRQQKTPLLVEVVTDLANVSSGWTTCQKNAHGAPDSADGQEG